VGRHPSIYLLAAVLAAASFSASATPQGEAVQAHGIGISQPTLSADDDDVPPMEMKKPRYRGGYATFPASLPVTPAGPPALSLRGLSSLATALPIPARLRQVISSSSNRV